MLLHAIFNIAGGIYDFRINFSAFCLYGIWIRVVLNEGNFSMLAGQAPPA